MPEDLESEDVKNYSIGQIMKMFCEVNGVQENSDLYEAAILTIPTMFSGGGIKKLGDAETGEELGVLCERARQTIKLSKDTGAGGDGGKYDELSNHEELQRKLGQLLDAIQNKKYDRVLALCQAPPKEKQETRWQDLEHDGQKKPRRDRRFGHATSRKDEAEPFFR